MQQEQTFPQQSSVLQPQECLEANSFGELRGFRKRWLADQSEREVGGDSPKSVGFSDEFQALLGDGVSEILPTTPAKSVPEGVGSSCSFEQVTCHDGLVASHHDTTVAVDRQYMSSLDLNFVKLPWETGVMKEIFGDSSAGPSLLMPGTWNLDPPLDDPNPEGVLLEAVGQHQVPSNLFSHVVRSVKDLTYFEDRERMMARGVSKWRIVIEYDMTRSDIGRSCVDSEDELASSIRAALGTKSPNTVVGRANAFLALMRWVCTTYPSEAFLPLGEAVIWKYISWLRDNNCPPTKPARLIQSIRFAHYIFGVDGLSEVLKSRRVLGACDLALANKPVTKQARALTVEEVRKLHSFAADGQNNCVDRSIVSHMLLMLYGRCRHSDTLAVESINHDHTNDRGYIELNTRFHKGNRTVAKKSLVLPILIPTCGVGRELWAEDWWQIRMELGLPTDGSVNGPLMPAPKDADGKAWAKRPLTSQELGEMLRSVLDCLTDEEVSSHSLKVTTLTWCSKGEVPREHRRILGRHSSSIQGADSFYARELAFPPVRSLERVISDICLGYLLPDGSRTLFRPREVPLARTPPNGVNPQSVLPQTPIPMNVELDVTAAVSPVEEALSVVGVKEEQHGEAKDNPVVVEVSSSSESSSEDGDSEPDSSSDDEQLGVGDTSKRVRLSACEELPEEDEKWVKHKRTKIVHRCWDSDVAMTFCGRTVNNMFNRIQSITDWTGKCRICFRGSRGPVV